MCICISEISEREPISQTHCTVLLNLDQMRHLSVSDRHIREMLSLPSACEILFLDTLCSLGSLLSSELSNMSRMPKT